MLQKWEQGDADTLALWNKMNSWVYEGFEKSYSDLGVDFDKLYYDSRTYIKGKQLVLGNMSKNESVFYKKPTSETEQKIKEETKATIRCIPINNKLEKGSCIYSGNSSTQKVLFAKSYQMNKKKEILNKLCQKASTKQAVYRTSKDVFEETLEKAE